MDQDALVWGLAKQRFLCAAGTTGVQIFAIAAFYNLITFLLRAFKIVAKFACAVAFIQAWNNKHPGLRLCRLHCHDFAWETAAPRGLNPGPYPAQNDGTIRRREPYSRGTSRSSGAAWNYGRHKRTRSDGDDDEEEQQLDDSPRSGLVSSSAGGARRRLACPYYMFNPVAHDRCMRFDMYETWHVAQHLRRCHASSLPFRCQHCRRLFASEDQRHIHVREPGGCRPVRGRGSESGDDEDSLDALQQLSQLQAQSSSDPGEQMRRLPPWMLVDQIYTPLDAEQIVQLADRSKMGPRRQPEQVRWNRLWSIVFPRLPPPTTCWLEERDLLQAELVLRRANLYASLQASGNLHLPLWIRPPAPEVPGLGQSRVRHLLIDDPGVNLMFLTSDMLPLIPPVSPVERDLSEPPFENQDPPDVG